MGKTEPRMTPQEQPDSHQDCTFDAVTGKELTHRTKKVVAVLPDSQAGDELRSGELYRLASLVGTDAKTPFTNLLKYVEAYAERLATERAEMERIVETDCTIKILQEMKAPKHVIKAFQEKYDELTATLTKEAKQ